MLDEFTGGSLFFRAPKVISKLVGLVPPLRLIFSNSLYTNR